MEQPNLDPRPARTDLTDRECARIIGGLLGSLRGVAVDGETLRRAVRWWAESDDAWTAIEKQQRVAEYTGAAPRRD